MRLLEIINRDSHAGPFGFLQIRIDAVAYMVEPLGIRPAVSPDPDDDWVPYTAAAGQADILCTLNTRHFTGPDARACCTQHGIRIMTDLEALPEVGN
jgi:hypothetical protein